MSVFLSMALTVILWSLYPLIATIGLKSMGGFEMIIIVYYFAGFGSILLGVGYLLADKQFSSAIAALRQIGRKEIVTILVSGVAGVLCHAFFIISLTMANKGGVSLLYESWPVIAVIATPFLIRKSWKEVSLSEFLISIAALIGVAIIILSDKEINLFSSETKLLSESFNYRSLGGYILAFAGAYMCAILIVTKGSFSESLKTSVDPIGASLLSEIFSRFISMVLVTILWFVMRHELNFTTIDWGSTAYIGFMLFVVGGALYTYGLLKSDRPTVHILYYFVPVFAVIWLWMAGESEINAGLFIGGALVVGANIYLVFAGRKAKFADAL